MRRGRLAAVADEGRAAVLQGTRVREDAPERTGRWGPSVILRPFGSVSAALAMLAAEAAGIAGSHQWRSGDIGRAHVTVRALERYVCSLPDDRSERYVTALQRATLALGPIGFELRGIVLSAGSVMARATPVDDRADLLRQRLSQQLREDGWLENRVLPSGRDPIWYCSLLHFAGPIASPERLVEWAAAHCDAPLGENRFTVLDMCTWTFDAAGMAPKVVASASTT